MSAKTTPTILTVAGFDPYGGAGSLVDVKTIHALDGYALSAVTALTAQNSQGVHRVDPVDPVMLRAQLEALLMDIHIDAIKIGMLATQALVDVVADTLHQYQPRHIVLDPVILSSSGHVLLDDAGVEKMIERLFPLATLITPNLDESKRILERGFQGYPDEIDAMANGFAQLSSSAILFKGGHTQDAHAVDTLVARNTQQTFSSPRIATTRTHGTGCILSSAIATLLAQGITLTESVAQAKAFLTSRIQHAQHLHLPYHEKSSDRHEAIF